MKSVNINQTMIRDMNLPFGIDPSWIIDSKLLKLSLRLMYGLPENSCNVQTVRHLETPNGGGRRGENDPFNILFYGMLVTKAELGY